ncbi:MAG: hypothetical protein FWF19_01885 [Euryarchaeota archaeon]|nr:hypothetical protein [Euryarchaeota archaeon]
MVDDFDAVNVNPDFNRLLYSVRFVKYGIHQYFFQCAVWVVEETSGFCTLRFAGSTGM